MSAKSPLLLSKSMGICVEHFGRVERLLLAEHEAVEPGLPLFVYSERGPTRDEYDVERERRYEAEDDARQLRRQGPIAPFGSELRRRRPGKA